MSFEVRPTRVLTLGPSPNAFGALENHSLSRLGFLLQFGGYSSAHLVVSTLELKKNARKKGQTWPSRQGSGGAVSWGWGRALGCRGCLPSSKPLAPQPPSCSPDSLPLPL